MKKSTLLVALVFASSAIFAKGGQPSETAGGSSFQMAPFNSQSHSAARTAPSTNHTNAAFYSEDFAGGAIPAGWTNVDALVPAHVWKYTLTGARNIARLNTNRTTAGNGYIIFDSDSSGATSTNGENAVLTTTAINCTGHPLVRLALNEYFRQYVASTGVISISNDGTTWTEIHHAEAGLTALITATANPLAVDLDVSAYAANQATVYLRFEYIGNWDYYWMIDDIQLYEPIMLDAGITNITTNFNSCTLSSTEPITVLIKNYGLNPISNLNVSYRTTISPAVTEVYTGTIAPFDTASYTFTQTADFSVPNFYGVQSYTSLTGDGENVNDTSITVASSYSGNLTLGAYTQGFEPTDDYSGYTVQDIDADGVGFDINTAFPHTGTQCIRKALSTVADDDWLYTTCIDIGASGTYALSYWYKNFELLTPCSLEVYMGTANNSTAMTNLVVQSPVPSDTTYQQTVANIGVPPGTYFLGFHFYSVSGGTSSLRLDDINIDFNNAVNTITTSAISVYPNPSNGKINIVNTDKNVKDYSVVVYNSLGAVVFSQQFTNLSNEQIDLGNQPSGIYSVQLKSAKNTINKSIVIANN